MGQKTVQLKSKPVIGCSGVLCNHQAEYRNCGWNRLESSSLSVALVTVVPSAVLLAVTKDLPAVLNCVNNLCRA